MSVQRRCDGKLSAAQWHPNGTCRIPATLTRVGVLNYRRADGAIQRELRHPDEVFAADSLSTLAAVPLTVHHPKEMVDPSNYRRLSVGHVCDNVRQDDGHVAADVVVTVDEALAQVESGALTEISCGYRCDYDPTPGEWDGEPYDGVQRSIRYNHAALLPSGTGRAGRTVGLRLDSEGHEIECDQKTEQPPVKADNPKGRQPVAQGALSMAHIRIDEVDYDPATSGPALGQAVDRLQKRLTAVEKKAESAAEDADRARADASDLVAKVESAAKAELEAAQAETEVVKAEVAEAKAATKTAEERADAAEKALAEATTPAALDKLVAERQELIETARKVIGKPEQRFDGMSASEIRRNALAILHGNEEIDAAEQAYVDAAFAYLAKHKAEAASRQDAVTPTPVPAAPRPAPTKSDKAATARKPFQAVTPPWRAPLGGE